jgi:hypothetical protein
MNGADRYHAKRQAGISPVRKDGSLTSAENDRQAAAAERYAAEILRCHFNGSVTVKGDGGYDFVLPLKIEVVWMGINAHTGEPRRAGNLIMNPDEPHRWADIYVVIAGTIETGFTSLGWTTHAVLIEHPLKDFGFGQKLAMPTNKLYGTQHLITLRRAESVEVA